MVLLLSVYIFQENQEILDDSKRYYPHQQNEDAGKLSFWFCHFLLRILSGIVDITHSGTDPYRVIQRNISKQTAEVWIYYNIYLLDI